ncbi:HAMP domain-containing sensor histidine kinase [Asanoa sp. WMMD1127]|uniref:HAMP domain-containing sensor histidine kinase n=1 Tax=Asanoa sp. WMMD1127 TaxID=3016107 RepID=UPI002416EDEF|nr:HAMP domain-containing sensor histidine kinase [Asanoa sp. WMMD1127]MDG4822662.1 HAMP domain-containing sensor histidine kinase [Asanoa sp. WMMD1127]
MRWRLTLLVAATTTLTLVAFLVPLALLLRDVAEDRATDRATADVQGIVPVVGTADRADIEIVVEQLNAAGRRVTVFLPEGGAPVGAQAARTPAVELAATGTSLTAARDGGREIVIGVGRSGGTAVIRTVVPEADLHAGVTRAWLVLAALGLVLVVVGLLVADRLARSLVRPIDDLSAVSHRLARAELGARAVPTGPPEVREVAGALNHLAERIQVLLREEREQVADLSHRLRTPLTALRLEAESVRDPDERARVTAGVDALERAVTGLIRQARWRSAPSASATCDAVEVVRDRVEFWSVLAEDTGRAVRLSSVDGPLPVGVAADELAAAVDAVLGNVFAHTPDGTPFAVTLSADRVLVVSDAGPGLSAAVVSRGVSQGGGTGLGLDIARRAAAGGLDISDNPGGGAVVTLRLAAPPSS